MIRKHSYRLVAFGGIALLIYVAYSVVPNRPLTDRQSPEFAARFEEAGKFNNEILNNFNQIRADELPEIFEMMRRASPNADAAQIAKAKTFFNESTTELFEETSANAQHSWARYHTVEDLRFMHQHHRKRLPIRLQALRIGLTQTLYSAEFDRMLEEIGEKNKVVGDKIFADTMKILGGSG